MLLAVGGWFVVGRADDRAPRPSMVERRSGRCRPEAAARLELDETVGTGMALDPVVPSRIQFAFVISFHVVFVAFTVWLVACGSGSLYSYRPRG